MELNVFIEEFVSQLRLLQMDQIIYQFPQLSTQLQHHINFGVSLTYFTLKLSYNKTQIQQNMYEVKSCSICNSSVKIEELDDHLTACSSFNSTPDKKDSPKLQRNVEANKKSKEVFGCQKFLSAISNQLQLALSKAFPAQTTQIKISSNKEISIMTSSSDQMQLQQIQNISKQIMDSFVSVPLEVQSKYINFVYALMDQFVIDISDEGTYMLAKKDQATSKLTKFYGKLIKVILDMNKVKLVSQILELQEEQTKQLEDIVKSAHMFVVDFQNLSVKVKNSGAMSYVFISGTQQQVSDCPQAKIGWEQVAEHSRFRIIKKYNLLQKYKQTYGIKYEIRNSSVIYHSKLNEFSSVYLFHSSNILVLPKSTVIIVGQDMMKEIREIQQSVHFLKDYIFFSASQEGSAQDSLQQFINYYLQSKTQIGMILPEVNKQEFISQSLEMIKSCMKETKFYLLERRDVKQAIQALQNILEKQKKWYAIINDTKVYYPSMINERIQQAMKNGLTNLIVTHKQLGIKKITHDYLSEEGCLIHLKSGIQHLCEYYNGLLTVFLEQDQFLVELDEKKPGKVILVVEELDLVGKIQRSWISGKKYQMGYDLQKKENQKYNQESESQMEVIIKYPDMDSIDKIWKQIQNEVFSKRILKIIPIDGLRKQKIADIENWCKLHKFQTNIQENILIATCYSQAQMANLQKLLQMHNSRMAIAPLQYPDYWNKDQKEDVKLYHILEGSEQFLKVQAAFEIGKIKKLERIQNRILLDKYTSEKIFLTEQNGSDVRELMMFHGTRKNKPELIYNDLEESFNINYANMGSYGKGIYFAKRSSYSNNYCYMDSKHNKQMFYCLVLAGKSEIYNGSQTLNTNFRDKQKKVRFQSVVESSKQEIMVVFKNRRAYPLYLITY